MRFSIATTPSSGEHPQVEPALNSRPFSFEFASSGPHPAAMTLA